MFKGKIKVFDEDGNLTKEYPNAFVLSGRYFALEALLPVTRGGTTWLEELESLPLRYYEPGDSTVVNGNDGPAESGGAVDADDWVNGSLYDYNIKGSIINTTEQTTRDTVTVLRRDGRSVTVEFELNNTYKTGNEVHEVGIFLGDGNNLHSESYPSNSPDDGDWGANDRKHAMIARILFVKYNEGTHQWEEDPIDISSPQTVQYEMRMI